MSLLASAGLANISLEQAAVAPLGTRWAASHVRPFPDGLLHVEFQESVRGGDVYLFRPIGPPVEAQSVEPLSPADARRRAGAAHLTAAAPRKRRWFKRPKRENAVRQGVDAEGNVS